MSTATRNPHPHHTQCTGTRMNEAGERDAAEMDDDGSPERKKESASKYHVQYRRYITVMYRCITVMCTGTA